MNLYKKVENYVLFCKFHEENLNTLHLTIKTITFGLLE